MNTPKLLLISFIICFVSCSKDDQADQNQDPISQEEPLAVCTYEDLNVVANSTVVINCLLDLEGETITLPENVTFAFDGGSISNGALAFGSGGKIAGELLNSQLIVEGDVKLLTNTFEFVPSRWDIIEGEVSSNEAESNKLKMNEILLLIQSLNPEESIDFIINNLDAYFKVDGYDHNNIASPRLGIKIPSHFNIILSDEVFFRMYPNGNIKPTLIFIGDGVENVSITGGNFVGDRDEHDYSDGNHHEWGHILRIGGAKNVTISESEFIDAMGDGIDVHGVGHSFDPNHISSTEIYITRNTFRRSRRNQISVTAGSNIYIEDNNFIDCSIHTEDSQGIAPGFAIDVEAFRANGIEYEIAEDIYIKNNIESGSRIGAFTVHTGDNVTIDNNTVEGFISYSNSTGTKIINNTVIAATDAQKTGGVAIWAGRSDRFELNHSNTVIGNRIEDYGTGILATNVDIVVAENTILECVRGITIEELKRGDFYDNFIHSSHPSSTGYISGAAATFLDDLTIRQKDLTTTYIDVNREPFKFFGVNSSEAYNDYLITIENNKVKSPGTSTLSCTGILFTNNEVEGGVRLANGKNITVSYNTINSPLTYGIRIDEGCSNLMIQENVISATSDTCIIENSDDGINFTITSNTCN